MARISYGRRSARVLGDIVESLGRSVPVGQATRRLAIATPNAYRKFSGVRSWRAKRVQCRSAFRAEGGNQTSLHPADDWVACEEEQPSADFAHAGVPQLLCHASQRPIHFFTIGVSRVRL
jgi:hypothetical protein